MAMKKCSECGNQVSTKAKNCPACGVEITTAKSTIKKVFRYVTYAMFALILYATFKVAFLTTAAMQKAG